MTLENNYQPSSSSFKSDAIARAAADCYEPVIKALANPYIQGATTAAIGLAVLAKGASPAMLESGVATISESAPKTMSYVSKVFRFERAGAGLGAEAASLVRTKDIDRTLIRMEGYTADDTAAGKMEAIISGGRAGVLKGDLKSATELESFVHGQYFDNVRSVGSSSARLPRDYTSTGAGPKNLAYAELMYKRFVDAGGEHTAEAIIGNKKVSFIRSFEDGRYNASIYGPRWELPTNPAVFEAADQRKNELFSELLASRKIKSATNLDENLRRVGEMEWLNAQTWKYNRGSAGISQLEARTWLEVAGVDSSRFVKGVDPNLEALSTPLATYRERYKSFFETAPKYFG